jgi:hydroxymethylpyrimidine/phosphomethylpyrimidine kinase
VPPGTPGGGAPGDRARPPVALTIAGSDSGGGAGIAADLKTFAAHGVHGILAITAVTAQDTCGISGIHLVPPALVREQIERVHGDLGVDAAKVGMLGSAETVRAVADVVGRLEIHPLVVDPVLAATTGRELLEPDALSALVDRLLPLATLVTPNLAEAGAMVGGTVKTLTDMREAAVALYRLGPQAVLVTGGHLEGDPVDVLYDGDGLVELRGERIAGRGTHGSGCVLSAAVTARMAAGVPLGDAVRGAKAFVAEAISHAHPLGHGEHPVRPF